MNRFAKRALALLLTLLLLTACLPAAMAENPVTTTVYFTLSNDGVPVRGADGTAMAHIRVTVPYFDLQFYGLEDYYRYETDGDSGPYINETLIKRPTLLHLYIYMLERYCLGIPAKDCCKGNLDIFEPLEEQRMDINDRPFGAVGNAPLSISGGPTSLYMTNFWGHDENLMYYVNHQYPLMNPGWGSTSDYILLKDGDVIDVAMFTNWNFYQYGAFMSFERNEYYVEAGSECAFTVLQTGTRAVSGGDTSEPPVGIENVEITVWDEKMTQKMDEGVNPETGNGGESSKVTDAEGRVTWYFDEPGTYMLLGSDPNYSTDNAAFAPATAIIHVLEQDEAAALTGLSLGAEELYFPKGWTYQFNPILTPANATNVDISWSSSEPNIVLMSDLGVIHTLKSGSSVITCTAKTDTASYTASCTVNVATSIPVSGIEISQKMLELPGTKDASAKLSAAITPSNATKQSLLWRTSECPDFDKTYTQADHTLVKVDHLGNVTVLQDNAKGVVKILVKSDDGDFTDECSVVVGQKYGDMNGNGAVNVQDAVWLLQAISNSKDLDETQTVLADVNSDGKVNVQDAVRMLRYIAGFITQEEWLL